MEQVESVAYKLKLPQELSRVHNTFHVSNLKKCYSDDPLVIPLEGLQVDNKRHFVEEPVEIMDREVKQLRRSRVPIVKVRWNSRRGPEFTWEREDQFRKKYPHLFTKTAPSTSAMNFMKKFIGTVRFGNDHFGAIMGYVDYMIGESVISKVYYVEGLGYNLFSVGQFCDSDIKVAFRKHSCYVRDIDGV
ncbi:hypothetical protein Tco_1365263 [Tanacetum coccineum]